MVLSPVKGKEPRPSFRLAAPQLGEREDPAVDIGRLGISTTCFKDHSLPTVFFDICINMFSNFSSSRPYPAQSPWRRYSLALL